MGNTPFLKWTITIVLALILSTTWTQFYLFMLQENSWSYDPYDVGNVASDLIVKTNKSEEVRTFITTKTKTVQQQQLIGVESKLLNRHQQDQHKNQPTNARMDELINNNNLDFAIVGFAKCASTFLLRMFVKSNHTFMGTNKEIHLLQSNKVEEFMDIYHNHVFLEPKNETRTINGYKAPAELLKTKSLHNLATFFPYTNFIVTMRHPILWFESLYNYRVRQNVDVEYPSPDKLIGDCSGFCLDRKKCIHGYGFVCTGGAKFHVFLSRLGWTPMDTKTELDLLDHHKHSIHNFSGAKLFLLEVGQLDLENKTRTDSVIGDMESFVGLEEWSLARIDPTTKRENHYKIDEKFENLQSNFIHICDEQHTLVRNELLSIGIKASEWIKKYFMKSPHVIISDEQHFVDLLDLWKIDPCIKLS